MKLRLESGLGEFGRVLALFVLTQSPFWLMQTRVMIQRPVVNLDPLLAVVVMFWSRPLGLFALALAWLAEINHDASASYHFVGAADLVDAVRFVQLVNLGQILSWRLIVVAVVMTLCAAGLASLTRQSRQPVAGAVALALLGLATFGADALNGSNNVFGNDRDRFVINANIAGSPGLSVLRALDTARRVAAQPMARSAEPVTYDRAVAWHMDHPGSSVLLVLVESMGLPRSPAIQAWMESRLDTAEIQRRWIVQSSKEPFHGSTVYGELRVLCGLDGHYSHLKPADEARCLPRRFLSDGGQALGLHGFNMRMFDRRLWWRELGLAPQDFSAEAGVPGDLACNEAFPGVCDGVVLHRAARLADAAGRLVYVVTLDTHLPLPARSLAMQPALVELCASERVPADACQMINRLGTLLSQLAANVAGMTHPPLVLVSGDHAPPFLESATRDAFDSSHVLDFMLEPR